MLAHLERNGVERRPHIRKLTDEQVAEAAELYRAGWSRSRISEHYSVSSETIRKKLLRVVQSRASGPLRRSG